MVAELVSLLGIVTFVVMLLFVRVTAAFIIVFSVMMILDLFHLTFLVVGSVVIVRFAMILFKVLEITFLLVARVLLGFALALLANAVLFLDRVVLSVFVLLSVILGTFAFVFLKVSFVF